jgi:hypothetical protein
LKVWFGEDNVNILDKLSIVKSGFSAIVASITVFKELHFFFCEINVQLRKDTSELLDLDCTFSQGIKILEVFFSTFSVNFDFITNLVKKKFDLGESYVVWSSPFSSIRIIWDILELLEEMWLNIFDKVDIINFTRFSTIHFSDGVMFIVSDIEV